MSKTAIGRPEITEFAEYYTGYIGKVPGSDIMSFLQDQLDSTASLIRGLDEAVGALRYEPGKWTVKELIGHIIDTERVFAYRALVFSRNDSTSLPGFDQEPWAKHAPHGKMSMADLASEFESVRRSTIHLFRHLDADAWSRRGIGNNKEMTTRAAAYIIAGHTQHHLDILKSRYLGK